MFWTAEYVKDDPHPNHFMDFFRLSRKSGGTFPEKQFATLLHLWAVDAKQPLLLVEVIHVINSIFTFVIAFL